MVYDPCSNCMPGLVPVADGWQLGEHNMWCKMSVFDVATRIPLIVSAPFLPQTHGMTTNQFAEAVDIFQTLAELAGIPVDVAVAGGPQGQSLVPLIEAPATASVHTAALSQFPRCWQNSSGAISTTFGVHMQQFRSIA